MTVAGLLPVASERAVERAVRRGREAWFEEGSVELMRRMVFHRIGFTEPRLPRPAGRRPIMVAFFVLALTALAGYVLLAHTWHVSLLATSPRNPMVFGGILAAGAILRLRSFLGGRRCSKSTTSRVRQSPKPSNGRIR